MERKSGGESLPLISISVRYLLIVILSEFNCTQANGFVDDVFQCHLACVAMYVVITTCTL